MKLVAAKCPTCGSNINVDPNQETMKCEYCRNAILIDDAITKYKLEISGELEIKNLPKIENYLQLADRNFKSKNYNEAYKIYDKILELDSNNPIALIRYGVCKTLLNNYIDFSMDYLINSFKETINIIDNNKNYNENIQTIVDDTVYATDKSFDAVIEYYNSYNVNLDDIKNILIKLNSILSCYEMLLNYTVKKEYIIYKIISVLQNLIQDKDYKTGTSIYGGDYLETYKLNHIEKLNLTEKLNNYEKILNHSSKEKENKIIKNNQLNINNNFFTIKAPWPIIAIDIFLGLLIIGSLLSLQILSSLIMIFIFLIITYENISDEIFKKDKQKKKYCIIILIILLFITITNGI